MPAAGIGLGNARYRRDAMTAGTAGVLAKTGNVQFEPDPSAMENSQRPASFGARCLFVVGTVALLLWLLVVLAGGFVLDAGPLHLAVRNWGRPLLVAAASWLVLGRIGRATVSDLGEEVWPFVERHAVALAIVLAAATAAAGVAHGTYAASGSDAAGYVSQADLMSSGRLSLSIPLAEQVGWQDAASVFAPLGYRAGAVPGAVLPTYPPGLPLILASAQVVAGSDAVYLVVPMLGAMAVICAFTLGRRLHSPAAGVVGATLMATSPILLFQVSQPMSDVAAMAWFALALTLAARATPGSALLAGASAGLMVLTRPVLLPLLLPVSLTILIRGRITVRAAAALLAGFVPFAVGLAALQQRLYGNAFGSGHGSFSDFFGWENVWPNLGLIVGRFVTGETAMLFLTAVAAMALVRARRHAPPPGASSPVPAIVVGVTSLAIVLLCYLPYGVFYDWFYLRFLLPVFPAVFVGAGALAASAGFRLPPATRGITLLVALTTVGSVNVNEARRQEAFLVRRSEARYQIAGRYLEAMLPEEAVVLAGQESASVHHYARRPVVRWDVMTTNLDQAVSDLRALGRRPVFVLEEWEERQMAARFPRSSLARLDWRPRADIGDHVRVRVYDPAEQAAPGPLGATDRIHAP